MDLEREWEEILRSLIENNSSIECDEDERLIEEPIKNVKTFEEATLLTYDRGVVVNYEDGRQIQITIVEC